MVRLIRRRYLALKIDCAEPLEQWLVWDAVLGAVLRLFGEVGASRVSLRLIHFESEAGYLVVRCSHKALPMVRAAIASVTRIGNKPAAVHVLMVSGTLKTLKRKSTRMRADRVKSDVV